MRLKIVSVRNYCNICKQSRQKIQKQKGETLDFQNNKQEVQTYLI